MTVQLAVIIIAAILSTSLSAAGADTDRQEPGFMPLFTAHSFDNETLRFQLPAGNFYLAHIRTSSAPGEMRIYREERLVLEGDLTPGPGVDLLSHHTAANYSVVLVGRGAAGIVAPDFLVPQMIGADASRSVQRTFSGNMAWAFGSDASLTYVCASSSRPIDVQTMSWDPEGEPGRRTALRQEANDVKRFHGVYDTISPTSIFFHQEETGRLDVTVQTTPCKQVTTSPGAHVAIVLLAALAVSIVVRRRTAGPS